MLTTITFPIVYSNQRLLFTFPLAYELRCDECLIIIMLQEPGDIEAEFAQIGVRRVVEKFLTYRDPAQFRFPKGKGFGDSPDTPVVLPLWLSKEDVDYYASKFEQTGFTGGINYYRALDL